MSKEILQRIADGRTDLVLQYVSEGHPARSTDHTGTPLIICCAEIQKGSAALETPTEAELARRKKMRTEG